jgi:NAD(P)-dependent dehydrogenase (short-subunit alcohol dehydrogenase family)
MKKPILFLALAALSACNTAQKKEDQKLLSDEKIAYAGKKIPVSVTQFKNRSATSDTDRCRGWFNYPELGNAFSERLGFALGKYEKFDVLERETIREILDNEVDLANSGRTRAIEKGVGALPGVEKARLNFTDRRLAVEWRGGLDVARLLAELDGLGYRAHPFDPKRSHAVEAQEARRLLRAMAVAGFASMNIMLMAVSVWAGNVSDITPETRDFFHWMQALIALSVEKFGRIDCLFNNAGGPAQTGGIEGLDAERFDAAMATLVRSVMLGMKHAAPHMRRQGSGSIINNGSIAGRLAGFSSSMVYGAAKAAVIRPSRLAASATLRAIGPGVS